MRLVITGVPGTGKTTLAQRLARATGWPALHANDLVKQRNLWKKGARDGSVDLAKLAREMEKQTRGKPDFIAEGHLLCEVRVPCDAIVVLRCRPDVLKRRLARRKYPTAKLNDNLLCEIEDYCLDRAQAVYPKTPVRQWDTTRPPTLRQTQARLAKKATQAVDWRAFLLDDKKRSRLLGKTGR